MRFQILVWTFVAILLSQGTAWSEDKGLGGLSVDGEKPSMELELPNPEMRIYEAELRYRMIWQLIGFVVALGVLHLIQVKLKMNRAYFWFVIGGAILMTVLSSYIPKFDPNRPPSQSDESPTYAPTHAR